MALMESFSGIRGIYGSELTNNVTEKYAIAYSNFIKNTLCEKKDICIVIGRDTRESGSILRDILIQNCNCKIIDVGVLPTATIEFAVRYFKADGGIIITASHNEPQYNGFKLLDNYGAVLNPLHIGHIIDEIHKLNSLDITKTENNSSNVQNNFSSNTTNTQEHKSRINNTNSSLIISNKSHPIQDGFEEALNAYCDFVENLMTKNEIDYLIKNKIKIIIDPNGGTGIISKKIFDKLGILAEYVNMSEGKFVRKIEPTKESLLPLVSHIKNHSANFAAGFDCDADRVELILENGDIVSGNHTLAIISKFIFSENNSDNKSPIIVVNDATSYVVKDALLEYDATWIEVEVGEVNVVNEMLKLNACIGGEGSNGGIIIPPSRCRDGIITLIYLFKAMAKNKKTLFELLLELPKYYYLSKKINLKEDFVLQKNKLKNYYISNDFNILESGDNTGGLKALKNTSWVWFRQSKTEDKVLRIFVDSKDENEANELINNAINLVK
ncbi:MAG: hypothetical protein WC758_00380 [Candidatus Woesearchaeota archaeon]|jgi:phosphomannomutase